jgi:chemotaxis protein CheD
MTVFTQSTVTTTKRKGQRIFDSRFGAFGIRVSPGDCYVTGRSDEMIVTILGSCVAACIRDPASGFGGLNHFMLPESHNGEWEGAASAALRYGNFAMEALINEVLKTGCRREDLEIKLFGGADGLAGPARVGTKNAQFARNYLAAEGLTVTSEDLGGIHGRRIHYFPATGKVNRLILKRESEAAVVREERRYLSTLEQEPLEGGFVLFD